MYFSTLLSGARIFLQESKEMTRCELKDISISLVNTKQSPLLLPDNPSSSYLRCYEQLTVFMSLQ